MVAGTVLEWRPPEGLAAAANEQEVRDYAAEIFALHRRDMCRCRREHGLETLQPRHVVGEAIGEAQGKGSDEALELEEALVGKVPSGRLVDRLDDAFMRVALAERRDAGEPVEQLHELLASLEFGLDVAPLGRLFGKLGQETRALGLAETGRAHELEARARRSSFLVGVDQAQHGCRRTGETQLVGEHVADEPRAFPRCPALRGRAHAVMAHIEAVGIAFTYLRHAISRAPGLAEALGAQDQPVVLDFEFDVAADRLRVERVLAVPVGEIGFARGGRRGELVDQCEEACGLEPVRCKAERVQHPRHPVAAFGEFCIGDASGHRNAEREHQTHMACMKRRVCRARLPDEIVEPVGAGFRNRFVDPALLVARCEPRADDGADARGREVQHLEARALRQALGKELAEDLTCPLVGADERGDFENEALRVRVAVEPRALVIDSVRKPVRQHVERETRLRMVAPFRIAEQASKERVARRG